MNNDLISRSALLEELKVQRGIERIKGVATINMAIDKGIEIAIRSIVSAPTVDAVPVVRCEGCIHKAPAERFGDLHCPILGVPMRNDDFCSYGERRSDVYTEEIGI